jgi:hypothetical protein
VKRLNVILVLLAFPLLHPADPALGQTGRSGPVPEVKNAYTPEQWVEDVDYLAKRLELVHPGLYAHIDKEEFDQRLSELRMKARTYSDVNMYYAIMELVNSIGDGHTWISWGDRGFGRFLHLPPLSVYMFSDGLFISSAVDKYASLVGKKIVRVGDVPTEEFMKRRSRLRSGENPWAEIASIDLFVEELRYLDALGPHDKMTLTLEDENGAHSRAEIDPVSLKEYFPLANKLVLPMNDDRITTMNGHSPHQAPLWLPGLDAKGNIGDRYWFRYLPEQNAVYLRIHDCIPKEDDPFPQFYSRMFKVLDERGAQRLIIDVRNNTGGQQLERPLLLGIIERPHINRTDRLFLIINRFVASSAQHLVTQLTRYTNATTFGEPTGSKPNFFGSHQEFTLPHSTICIAHSIKYWQDAGPNDFRIATEPDVYVPMTSADFRNNVDPVLERVFNYDAFKDLRPEFSETLRKAYGDGGLGEMKRVFASLKPRYLGLGFNMGNLLYGDFGGWLSENARRDEDYIEFLRFLRQELPNSIGVCWDLANGLDRSEDQEERIRLFKKCLEINPAHGLAKMRLDLIEFEAARWKADETRHQEKTSRSSLRPRVGMMG